MITLLTTFITERVVTFITMTLLAVAAVPTTLVLVSQHQVVATEEHRQVVLIQALKDEGNLVIARLQNAQASCDSQIQTVIAGQPKLGSVPRIQTAVTQGRDHLNATVANFVLLVQDEEEAAAKLAVLTPALENVFLEEIHSIQLIALGDGTNLGVVTITCQTVVIEIKEIVILVIHKIEVDDD